MFIYKVFRLFIGLTSTLLCVCRSEALIMWGPCPPSQSSASSFPMDCANISYPLNYNDPSMGSVNAFVRRMYASEPTNTSIWMIAGGPGDSTLAMVPICDFYIGADPSFTCYTQDARGTGLSSYMSCGENQPAGPFNPYNETCVTLYKECFEKIIADYGDQLQYYSTYNSMSDLLGTVQAVNPTAVNIYAQSYGTYALNTYMLLPNARADSIVLDGPVPPNRWPLENNAEWTSQVAMDVSYGCASNSSVCRDRISDMAHIPRIVMDSLIDKTLPCLQNISWLNAEDGQFWSSVYTNYCTGGDVRNTAHLCLAPFWYRVHRCSESDIEQLNYFHQYQKGVQFAPLDPLRYSVGIAVNIGSSEVYSFSPTPLDYTMQVQRSARLLADAGVEMQVAYARNITNIPLYDVDQNVYMKFFIPEVPVLILVGTYDANTENGLGFWYQEGLGNMSSLLNVPYNSHVTVDFDSPCVDNIVLQFFQSLGTSYNTDCIEDIQEPDWDGSSQAAKDWSLEIFGTEDLWNDGYAVDTTPEGCICECSSNDDDHTVAIACGIAIPLGSIIIALIAYIVMMTNKAPMAKREEESNS